MSGINKDPILDFMVVRAPERVADAALRRRYIQDRVRIAPDVGSATHIPVDPPDPQAIETVSPIGRIVFDLVFHSGQQGAEALSTLRNSLLATLKPYRPAPAADPLSTLTLRLDELAQHAHLVVQELYYILPDRLEQLAAAKVPLLDALLEVRPILEAAAHPAAPKTSFNRVALRKELEEVFNQPVWQALFTTKGHSDAYIAAHRALFDTLYLLYLMRRWTSVD